MLVLALGSLLIIFLIYQPERGSGKERTQSRASLSLVFPKIFIRHIKMFLFVAFHLHSATDGSDTSKIDLKKYKGAITV